MIEIAEFIPPAPSPLWKLAKQAGVDVAVGGLPFDSLEAGEASWDLAPLRRMKDRYEAGGFRLAVIEARPPLNKAKRGLPGRDEEIATVCTLLENMGKLGIPVWCYEWMTDFNCCAPISARRRAADRSSRALTKPMSQGNRLSWARTQLMPRPRVGAQCQIKSGGPPHSKTLSRPPAKPAEIED